MSIAPRSLLSAGLTRVAAAAILTLLLATPAFAAPGGQAVDREAAPAFQGPQAAPDRLILKFREGATSQRRSDVRRQQGLERLAELGAGGAELARVTAGSLNAVIAALSRHPDVEYAEPDYVVAPDVDYTSEPMFGSLWGLHNTGQTINGTAGTVDTDVDASEASTVTLGDPGLVVAVIDDGVDFSHPDLAGREWVNPGESGSGRETNGVDDDGNGYVDDVNGWDFYHNDRTIHDVDEDEHGTHVAGTIAASLNGVGVVGVAPNVRIMALKFLGPDGGYTSDAVKAINYARAQGVRISNNSWGGGGYSQALKDAIDASGMLFVASAGNDGRNADSEPSYPAAYTSANILSVAAIANTGALASFSNYGPTSVDISAPGVSILSSVPATSTRAATWQYWNGTSMASPHATGVAALAATANPSLLTDPVALRQLILDRGKPAPRTDGKTVTGDMVDASAVVDATTPPPPPPPTTPPAAGTVDINTGAARAKSTTVSVAVPVGGDGVTQVRLSNNGSAWATYTYTSPISWSLSDTTYGGSTANGTRTVYAQWGDAYGNWSSTASDTIQLDTVVPTATAPSHAFATDTQLGTSTIPVRLAWSGSDATSGISRYELQQSTSGGSWTAVTLPSTTATSLSRSLSTGYTYRFRVRAVDLAGNVGSWMAGPTFSLTVRQENSTSVTYSGTWGARTSTSGAYGGYLRSTSTSGASASLSFTGRSIAWVAPRDTTMGTATIYVDNVNVGTVNLSSSTASQRMIVFSRSWTSSGSHTIQIRSSGTKISLDAFVVVN